MDGATEKLKRTASDTTVEELLEVSAPPRDGTTGVHLTAVGEAYLLAVQGPEALHMTRLILDFVQALHTKTEAASG